MTTQTETAWLKWECDHGRRWTTVKGSVFSDEEDGGYCQASRCVSPHGAETYYEQDSDGCCHQKSRNVFRPEKEGVHRIHLCGETSVRGEAAAWFASGNWED